MDGIIDVMRVEVLSVGEIGCDQRNEGEGGNEVHNEGDLCLG